jgi:type II secretory pathway component PulF
MRPLRPGRRVALYRSLAQLLDAGVPPLALVAALERGQRDPAVLRFLDAVKTAYTAGNPLSEAMLHATDHVVPEAHVAVVRAAERAGRTSHALRRLAAGDEARDKARRDLLRRAAYPVLLFHAALLAPALGGLIQSPVETLLLLAAIAIPVDVLLVLLFRVLTGGTAPAIVRRLADYIPGVERVVTDRAGADFLSTLGALYDAGVPVLDAADDAAAAVTDPTLRQAYLALVAANRRDAELEPLLAALPIDRPEIAGTLLSAVPAGELGGALDRSANLLDEYAIEGGGRLAVRIGGGLYAVAVVFVTIRVLGFYAEYFQAMQFTGR